MKLPRRTKDYAGHLDLSAKDEKIIEWIDSVYKHFSCSGDLQQLQERIDSVLPEDRFVSVAEVGVHPKQNDLILYTIASDTKRMAVKDISPTYDRVPTKEFRIGETVRWGALTGEVVWKSEDSTRYIVGNKIYPTKKSRRPGSSVKSPYIEYQMRPWIDLWSPEDFKGETDFTTSRERIVYYNSSVDSLIHTILHWEVDFNPVFQRGYEWEFEDKEFLIDSIFKGVDIGKFSFVKHSYSHYEDTGFLYTILDGKQRLSALLDFIECRFTYRGKYYNELSPKDRNHFDNFPISRGEVTTDDLEEMIDYFLILNTTGKVVGEDHLNKVKELKTKI